MENTITQPSKEWQTLHAMISQNPSEVLVSDYIAAHQGVNINYIPPSPYVQGYLPLLHRALCCETNLDLKNILTVQGLDVNLYCPGLGTPLIFIIGYKNDGITVEAKMERVNLLLHQEDINVNGPGCPLLEAVKCGRPEIVKALLAHPTIDIDLSVVGIPMIENRMVTILEDLIKGEHIDTNSDKDGTTFLVQLVDCTRHINTGSQEEIEKLIGLILQNKNTDVNKQTKKNRTALHSAIDCLSNTNPRSQFNCNVINMLLSHEKIDLKQDLPLFQLQQTQTNYFYRHIQNRHVFLDLWKTFLSHPGVDINAIHEGNMIVYVVLHYMYNRFKQSYNKDEYAKGWEVAHSAAVKIMKHPEFNVNAVINDKRQSLLLYTAEYLKEVLSFHVPSLPDIFQDSLCHPNLNFNTMDAHNMTVIRHTFNFLLSNENTRVVDIIKRYIEDERYLADTIHTDGSTDLHWLVCKDLKHKTAVTSYLLSAKPQMDVNVQNGMGETVLEIIVNQKGVQYQKDDIKLLDMLSDLLLHDKFDRQFLNKKYENGLTVIHVVFVIAELISESRMLNKWLNVVKMEEIDHNIQDKNGYTPIMNAVKNKNDFSLKAVKIILKVDSYDINIKNEHEQTVFDIVNTEKDIDPRMLALVKAAWNEKVKPMSELLYSSDISLDDQIKFMQKSIQRNLHLSRPQKEDLDTQLEGLASDINHYISDSRGSELEMSKDNREKLRGCRVYLVDNLETREILDHLIQNGIITDHQAEEINLQGPRRDKVFKLLSVLPTQGPEAYDTFIKALIETKQEYIAEKLESFNTEQKDAVATTSCGSVAVGTLSANSDIIVPINIPANSAMSLTLVFNPY